MSITTIDSRTAEKYIWGNNCESFVLVKTEGLSVKQERMPAGTAEKLHFHQKAQQFFYILKGIAIFHVENELITVNSYQGISIPAETKHFIENSSDSELEFLVISQPTTDKDRVMFE